MNVHFLPTVSMVFLLEHTVMLLLITSVKVRSTRTYMCEISSILLKFCARFWQISSKMFVIPPQISSIFSAWKEWQPCSKVAGFYLATLLKVTLLHGCFSRFLNCTNGTRSRETSHIFITFQTIFYFRKCRKEVLQQSKP